MLKRHLLVIIIASVFSLGLLPAASTFAENPVVITNKSVASGSVDIDTIKKIYSGYTTSWPDGSRIIVTIMEKSPVHDVFLKIYVGKSENQFKATWKKLMFTGKGKYPRNFDSADKLIEFVKSTPGAIGYVDTSINTTDVSVQP